MVYKDGGLNRFMSAQVLILLVWSQVYLSFHMPALSLGVMGFFISPRPRSLISPLGCESIPSWWSCGSWGPVDFGGSIGPEFNELFPRPSILTSPSGGPFPRGPRVLWRVTLLIVLILIVHVPGSGFRTSYLFLGDCWILVHA